VARKSLIDDVSLPAGRFTSNDGRPILYTNPEIRTMLELAQAGQDDIFYDLGCGWAQNLIIAAREYNVKKCVGIEDVHCRYRKSINRIRDKPYDKNVNIIYANYENYDKCRRKGANLKEATIVFYAIDPTNEHIIKLLNKKLQTGCKFVYQYYVLFPEIMPIYSDYPFYISFYPFIPPTSEIAWLKAVIQKSENKLKNYSTSDLWDELRHDYEVIGIGRRFIDNYKKRLKKTIKRKQKE